MKNVQNIKVNNLIHNEIKNLTYNQLEDKDSNNFHIKHFEELEEGEKNLKLNRKISKLEHFEEVLSFTYLEILMMIFCKCLIRNKELLDKKALFNKYSKEVKEKIDLLTLVENVVDKEIIIIEKELGI